MGKRKREPPSIDQVLADAARAAERVAGGQALLESATRLVAEPQSQCVEPKMLDLRDSMIASFPDRGRVMWTLLWKAMTKPRKAEWWYGMAEPAHVWEWRRLAVFAARAEWFNGVELHRFADRARAVLDLRAATFGPRDWYLGRGWSRADLASPGDEWLAQPPQQIVEHEPAS